MKSSLEEDDTFCPSLHDIFIAGRAGPHLSLGMCEKMYLKIAKVRN